MVLPPEVHRVVARGRPYYYWHPGRGTKRAEGKPIRLPDAEEKPKEFWIAVERLGGKPRYEAKSMAAMIEAYAASEHFEKLSDMTRRDYVRYLKFWTDQLGEFPVADVEACHIMDFRDLEYRGKASTANHSVAVLSAVYVWGIPRRFARSNPASDVKRIKIETDGRLPWPTWALEIAHEHFRPELRLAVALGLYTGQRLGDVLRMQRSDIGPGGIRVKQSKTKKGLMIPIHRTLRPDIDAALAGPHDYLVCREDGRPFTGQDFQAMWSREMAKEPHGRIKREGFSFHGLRTLAVAVLAKNGNDAIRIASITGQSLNIVELYLRDHSQQELGAQAIAAWENAP